MHKVQYPLILEFLYLCSVYSPCSLTVSFVFAETLELVLSLMKMIQLNFQNEFSSVVATLPPEYAPKIQQMFS